MITITRSLDEILARWDERMRAHGNITSELSDDDSVRHLIEQLVNDFTVELSESELQSDGHAAVCIDGRRCMRLADNSSVVPIRQKMAGGNLLTLWVGLELAQIEATTNLGIGPVNERLAKARDMLVATGFKVAGHNSTKATSDTNECGAAMKLVEAMQELHNQVAPMNHIVEVLVGTNTVPADALSGRTHDFIRALQRDEWVGTSLTNAIQEKIGSSYIETLESGNDETHNHHEQAVVFDFRINTTLDRDKAVNDSGQQVFWIDMDAIERLAEAFSSGQQEKAVLFEAMTAFQVAVYDALCDGTHPIAVVS